MVRKIRQGYIDRLAAGLAVFLLLGGWGDGGVAIGARELPVTATVDDISSHPERYDGSRVFVSGKVRSTRVAQGRMGSNFLAMVLEEAPPDVSKSSSVQVFSLTVSPFEIGSLVSVQGTYHHRGFYGGWPYDNFISAQAIIGEQPDSDKGHKGSGM